MKKFFCCIVLLCLLGGVAFSQSSDEWNWGGIVRIRPLSMISSLTLGEVNVIANWVPYVTPNIGIQIEADVLFIDGNAAISITGGVETVVFGKKEKNGLYLTAMAGAAFVNQRIYLAGKAYAGYQFVYNSGLVLIPAVGVLYIENLGMTLGIMLDIGFAYRRNR